LAKFQSKEKGKGVMTSEEAMLRLAENADDGDALIAIAENHGNALRAEIRRHFSGRAACNRMLLRLLGRISRHAKYFAAGRHDADQWVEHCANLECRRLRNEAEGRRAAPEHGPGTYYYH
jgi:hypothetical protein